MIPYLVSITTFPFPQNRAKSTTCSRYQSEYYGVTKMSTGLFATISGCSAGSYSKAEDDRIALSTLNYLRWLHGYNQTTKLDNDVHSEECACAVANAANNRLTHTPSGKCSGQSASSGCGSSNIAMQGWRSNSAFAVHSYYHDDYSMDTMGHRRWMINKNFGYTSFCGVYTSNGATYSAMRTFNMKTGTTENPPFVASPPPGYVPKELIPRYWSFHAPGLSNPRITVKVDGSSVSISNQGLLPPNYGITPAYRFTVANYDKLVNKKVDVTVVSGSNTYSYTIYPVDCGSGGSSGGGSSGGGSSGGGSSGGDSSGGGSSGGGSSGGDGSSSKFTWEQFNKACAKIVPWIILGITIVVIIIAIAYIAMRRGAVATETKTTHSSSTVGGVRTTTTTTVTTTKTTVKKSKEPKVVFTYAKSGGNKSVKEVTLV